MRAPLSWLKEFAPFPDDVSLLRATLDDLGLVVEDVEIVGEGLSDVVVARIDEVSGIDGADRIRRVMVEAGHGPIEIVCGATNFAVGDLVPLAPVGSVLPGGFEISVRKMRGVTSNGMLCSGKELGIDDDHAGLLILSDIEGAAPGMPLVDALGIESDVVFDVTVEGNRPDAWCIVGIARDLAARLGLSFSEPSDEQTLAGATATSALASGEIVDADLCSRLAISVVENVTVGPSPTWLARRLALSGVRSINNVVDASNYVMLELGQPTHPYDLDKVAGPTLRVRKAVPGESVVTLDGITRTLGVKGRGLGDRGIDCVICDGEDTVIAIAGIMGGASTEVDSATRTVLMEAATFDSIAVTRTSRRLALRTEAAARFSKGTDPGILERALRRVATLIALSSPDVVTGSAPLVTPSDPIVDRHVSVDVTRVNALLGTSFDASEIEALLTPLGFVLSATPTGALDVRVPPNRPDIRESPHGVADVIEEIARLYGYARIPRHTPSWPDPGSVGRRQPLRAHLRDALVGLGTSEAWTSSLVAPGELELLGIDEPEITVSNPLTNDDSRMRRSLIPGVLRAVGYNAERRQDDIALFEMGAVFVHPSARENPRLARAGSLGSSEVAVPVEEEHLVAAWARPGDDAHVSLGAAHVICDALRISGFKVINATQEAVIPGFHPTRSALLVDATTGVVIGAVGEADPELVSLIAPGARDQRVALLSLSIDSLADSTQTPRRDAEARLVSRFPSSDLDLAFSLDQNEPADRLLDVVTQGAGSLLESIHLFDVYRGPGVPDGSRSLAVRCRLSALDHTLSDDELSAVRRSMIDAASTIGAILR